MPVQTPYIPAKPATHPAVTRPFSSNATPQQNESLSLASLAAILIKGTVTGLPKQIGTLGLRMGIAFGVNTVLGSIATWKLGGFLASIVTLLVFLTASYNSIVPKALFWVLVMTIGVKLYHRVKADGMRQVGLELAQFFPNVQRAWTQLAKVAIPILGVGGGLGFVTANFLSRNNRIDKMLVCYVMAISVVDSLSRGTKSMLFLFLQAAFNDYTRLTKRPTLQAINYAYVAGGSFAVALVFNTVFSLLKLDYGGYIFGLIVIASSVGFGLTLNSPRQHKAQG